MRTTRMPTARSWILFALPAAMALAGCDRSPTEPTSPPEGLEAAKGGNGGGGGGGTKTPSQLIAFVSDHELKGAIYTIKPDGTGLRRVTSPATNEWERFPEFVPGNESLVFTRYSNLMGTQSELYSVNLKSRKVTRLTNLGALTEYPAVSPDGSKIAFISSAQGQANLYLMNIDGSNPVRLSASSMPESYPDWSPDGAQVIFRRSTSANSWDGQILTFNVTTLQTAFVMECYVVRCTAPRWSPTGNVMIYERTSPDVGNLTELRSRTVGLDNDSPWESVGENKVGGWSPDGQSFVFRSSRLGGDIFVRTGNNPATLLFSSPGIAWDPTWSR